MIGTSALKVPGGKLVRATVDYGHCINSVKITGDFFMHPEESLPAVERSLWGIDTNLSVDQMAEKVRDAVLSNSVVLIGVTEYAIARVVKEAMK